jgi:hypothetical protein
MHVIGNCGDIKLRKPFGDAETAGKRMLAETIPFIRRVAIQVAGTIEAVVKRC